MRGVLADVVVWLFGAAVVLALYPSPRALRRTATRAADRTVAAALAATRAAARAAARVHRRHP